MAQTNPSITWISAEKGSVFLSAIISPTERVDAPDSDGTQLGVQFIKLNSNSLNSISSENIPPLDTKYALSGNTLDLTYNYHQKTTGNNGYK